MGEYTAEMLKKSGFNLKLNENKFTRFSFNEEATPLSANVANEVSFKWSKSYCPKLAKFSYDSEKHKYTTTDFDSKFGTSGAEWENLILILDETEYIVSDSTRYIGYNPPTNDKTIHEFPSYAFGLGDAHPYVINTIFIIGLLILIYI